jgi:bacterioferritin-associated ferredoxin
LKGVGTKVVLRECPDCVADAAEFLEEQLNQE